jgi:hypothetical protein
MDFYPSHNTHDRLTHTGVISTQDVRRLKSARKNLRHLTRNGVYDPITHFHVLDNLLDIAGGDSFRTRDLLPYLRVRAPNLVWDAVTVGRVITDMAEALHDALGYKAIGVTRRFDGMWFDMSGNTEARFAMEHLLEDLRRLSVEEMQQEAEGHFPKRMSSPMERCPTVML